MVSGQLHSSHMQFIDRCEQVADLMLCRSHTLPDGLGHRLFIFQLVEGFADGAFACRLQMGHTA